MARVDLGIRPLERRVEAMRERCADLTPVTEQAAAELDELIRAGLSAGRTAEGEAWPPLAASTRATTGRSGRPFDSARFARSLRVIGEARAIVFGVRGRDGNIARIHHFGSRKARSPSRRFLPLDLEGRPSFSSGPAKAWADRFRTRTMRYILTGEVG